MKPLSYFFELVIVSVNFFLAHFLLRNFNFFYRFDLISSKEVVGPPLPLGDYLGAFWVAFLIWAVLLWRRGERQNFHVQTYFCAARQMVICGLFFFCVFTSAVFAFKFEFLSRMFVMTYTISSVAALIAERLVMLYLAKDARKKGHDVRHILLAGTGRRAQEFISHLHKHDEWGYQLVGLVDRDPSMTGTTVAGYPVVGALEDLPAILEREVVDEVVFVTPRGWLEEVRKCMLYCEAIGLPATISTDLFDLEIASASPKVLEGRTYLTVETRVPKGVELFVKRAFDITVASAVLVFLSPLLLAVALAVKLTSPGPIFFKQIRCGRNGRRFYLYKFRSMVTNAEALLAQLKEKNEMSGPVFKITDDPRITPIGKFLRKTSLDEFPQFWNVLKGDMSVVGPRPPLPSEVELYEPWHRRRLSMKPGITCIWQVLHRDGADFEQWMEMDLRYIDNWALLLDLKILFLTGRAVVAGSGR